MGLFDSVYADCPTCGNPVEFQSKEGECSLHIYTISDAPTEVLTDVLNDPRYCAKCGEWCALYDPAFPVNLEPPRPQPSMRKLRQPTTPLISDSQPSLRWWDEPFSEADFIEEQAPPPD